MKPDGSIVDMSLENLDGQFKVLLKLAAIDLRKRVDYAEGPA